MELLQQRVVLKYVRIKHGALFVMTSGVLVMLVWFVNNWATQELVRIIPMCFISLVITILTMCPYSTHASAHYIVWDIIMIHLECANFIILHHIQMPLHTPMPDLVKVLGLSSLTMLPVLERRTLLFHVPMTLTQLTASTLMMPELLA